MAEFAPTHHRVLENRSFSAPRDGIDGKSILLPRRHVSFEKANRPITNEPELCSGNSRAWAVLAIDDDRFAISGRCREILFAAEYRVERNMYCPWNVRSLILAARADVDHSRR